MKFNNCHYTSAWHHQHRFLDICKKLYECPDNVCICSYYSVFVIVSSEGRHPPFGEHYVLISTRSGNVAVAAVPPRRVPLPQCNAATPPWYKV